MAGTSNMQANQKARPMKTPAEQFRDEWYAKFIGILIPATLPLMERMMREMPTRIEAEQFRDKWQAQIAGIMVPPLLYLPPLFPPMR